MFAVAFQIQSFCIFLLLCLGVRLRKIRKLHVRLMLSAIIWDVMLILQIELGRDAIKKAQQVQSNPMILTIHVLLALLTVVFYGFMIHSGRRILKGNNQYRERHKILGGITLVLRGLTLLTSFFAVQRPA